MSKELTTKVFNTTVIVAALGYFVDVYDLILFSIVRAPSLASLGYVGEAAKAPGDFLLNMQLWGLMLGGIFWGIMGDVRGRLSVLFGSISMYSLANIANGFVADIPHEWAISVYAGLRFVAGVGLAGEFGTGITLINEIMTKEHRGWGTALVGAIGPAGAVVAAAVGNVFDDWKIAYWVGGGLGLLLLLLRFGTFESGMFERAKEKTSFKDSFVLLFSDRARLKKYLYCILAGVPIWFTIGIPIFLSGELSQQMGITEKIAVGTAIAWCYTGLCLGDFATGSLSQIFKSRKKILFIFIALSTMASVAYLSSRGLSSWAFYMLCLIMGFINGYWVVIITTASEQFGINIRNTVTTTVPNFIRWTVTPLLWLFRFLEQQVGSGLTAGLYVSLFCGAMALLALSGLEETFGKNLDYVEQ